MKTHFGLVKTKVDNESIIQRTPRIYIYINHHEKEKREIHHHHHQHFFSFLLFLDPRVIHVFPQYMNLRDQNKTTTTIISFSLRSVQRFDSSSIVQMGRRKKTTLIELIKIPFFFKYLKDLFIFFFEYTTLSRFQQKDWKWSQKKW